MTTVGKILVLANLVLSLFFMMFAVAVYTTRTDLRSDYNKLKSEMATAKEETANTKTEASAEKQKLNGTIATLTQQMAAVQAELALKTNEAKANAEEYTRAKDEVNRAVTQMKIATDEQVKRKAEVDQLIAIREDLLKKNSELVLLRGGLLDDVSKLTGDRDALRDRNVALDGQVKRLEKYITKKLGSVPDATTLVAVTEAEGPTAPPEIEGIITKVDRESKIVQISLGEDDGIRTGQVLEVWRTKPEPKWVGQIKVYTVDNSSATAKPVPGKINALVQENDRIGSRVMVNQR